MPRDSWTIFLSRHESIMLVRTELLCIPVFAGLRFRVGLLKAVFMLYIKLQIMLKLLSFCCVGI